MNRRSILCIAAIAAFVLAASLPQVAFAQGDLMTGSWTLNLAKSKYSPGPPPKSGIFKFEGDGQNKKNTTQGIDAEGKPTGSVFLHIYDGKFHPTTGSAVFDASAYTRVDAYTVIVTRTKAGSVVQIASQVVSRDGKELTVSTRGVGVGGQPINNVAVYDKQ